MDLPDTRPGDRYRALLADLLLRRAVEGPLRAEEEAELAAQRADLWEEIPGEDQAILESWIDEQMSKSDAQPRECVVEYVREVRRMLVTKALPGQRAPHDAETVLAELLAQMTDVERGFALGWRRREEAIKPVHGDRPHLPLQEAPDLASGARQDAA
ncbi:MAG: hypothetical protein WKG00_33985 [Polyangiaceae bacterium]